MIESMTGFGQAQRRIGGCLNAVEIRSLNSKYFRAILHLPEIWSPLESDMERRLHDRLGRGTLHLVLRMKTPSAEVAHQLNGPALERYVEQLEIVRPEHTDLELHVDLASLLLLPGVTVPPDPDEMIRQGGEELTSLIDEAIASLLAMRSQEGQTIAADLEAQCAAIEGLLGRIAARAPKVVQDYHDRLKRRVAELVGSAGLSIESADLAREVAVFAERCDIAEELSRLASHLAQFRAAMQQGQPGRKLDFLAQEMLREANTIAAKANDVEIARDTVEIKTAVDRIKEQVQNVV